MAVEDLVDLGGEKTKPPTRRRVSGSARSLAYSTRVKLRACFSKAKAWVVASFDVGMVGVDFEWAVGVVISDDGFGEAVEFDGVFMGHEGDLAGENVTKGVFGRIAFCLRG